MKKSSLFITVIAAGFFLNSCTKDKSEYDPNVKAEVSMEFDNIVGASDLQLNTGNYLNGVGQNFTVTTIKYFVSNFTFTRTDGTVYTVPQDDCYFLVDESQAASLTPVMKIPEGEYKSVSFVLGVDSLRNTKDVSQRTGVLDVSGAAAGMYWSWNSGYIFYKLEGTSPGVAPFKYHIGGFGGYSTPTTNNIRTFTLDLTVRGTAKVKTGKDTNIHLMVDVLKAIAGTTNMTFGTPAEIHSPTAGAVIANNYTQMISHDHTEN